MTSIVDNFRASHEVLKEEVTRVLHTQIGDAQRLWSKITEATQLRLAAALVGECPPFDIWSEMNICKAPTFI
jgi:hypothetical protein